jgi:hypothetical protein
LGNHEWIGGSGVEFYRGRGLSLACAKPLQ